MSAQDANFGFTVPVTLSAGGLYTGRLQSDEPGRALTGGFRSMFYPTLKLGTHWFAYGAMQVRLAPYFYYDAYDRDHEFYNNVIQAFLGYSSAPADFRCLEGGAIIIGVRGFSTALRRRG